MTLEPCLSLPRQLSMKFQLAVFSYFSLLNFIALSVQIIVLHFNSIVDKREKKLAPSISRHSYLYINHVKVSQGHATLFLVKNGKKPKFLTQLKYNSVSPFMPLSI